MSRHFYLVGLRHASFRDPQIRVGNLTPALDKLSILGSLLQLLEGKNPMHAHLAGADARIEESISPSTQQPLVHTKPAAPCPLLLGAGTLMTLRSPPASTCLLQGLSLPGTSAAWITTIDRLEGSFWGFAIFFKL